MALVEYHLYTGKRQWKSEAKTWTWKGFFNSLSSNYDTLQLEGRKIQNCDEDLIIRVVDQQRMLTVSPGKLRHQGQGPDWQVHNLEREFLKICVLAPRSPHLRVGPAPEKENLAG